MAVLAAATAGAALGAGVFGTATFLGVSAAGWGWAVGSVVGQLLFREGPDDQFNEGPRLQDLNVTSSTYNKSIPKVYGNMRLAGNVIWALPHRESFTDETEEVGGKGGGSSEVTTRTYHYHGRFAVGVCEGPIECIRRIWADGKVIYDQAASSTTMSYTQQVYNDLTDEWETVTGTYNTGGPYDNNIRIYTGTSDQAVDPFIEAYVGAGSTPAYRHLVYVVFEEIPLEKFGNRIPNLEFEVIEHGVSNAVAAVLRDRTYTGCTEVASTAIDAQLPASVQTGDLLLLFLGMSKIGGAPSGPAGWDLIDTIERTPDNAQLSLFARIADGSEGGSNVALSWPNALTAVAMCARVAGHSYESTSEIEYTLQHGFATFFTWYTDFYPSWAGTGESLIVVAAATTNDDNAVVEWTDSPGDNFVENGYDPSECGQGENASVRIPSSWDVHDIKEPPDHHDGPTIQVATFTSYAGIKVGVPPGTACSPEWVTLRAICESLCDRSGMDSTEYDFSRLTQLVYGFAIQNTSTARANLSTLQQAYFFDLVEFDGKIQGMPRNHADRETSLTLGDEELGAVPGGDNAIPNLEVTRAEEAAVPHKVRVGYMDPARDYLVTEYMHIDPTRVGNPISDVDLAIAMTGAEAKSIAIRTQQLVGFDRVKISSTAKLALARLIPTDIVQLIEEGNSFRTRLESAEFDGRSLEMVGVVENQAAYDLPADIPVEDWPDPTPSPFIGNPPTVVTVIDAPLLRDADEGAGFYLAVQSADPSSDNWRGGEVYMLTPNGQWVAVAGWSSAAQTPFGTLDSALGAPVTPWAWDHANTLQVTLDDSSLSLESVTEREALAGENSAAIGGPDRWEIVSYTTATEVSPGQWELTGLLRGRKGTEHLTGGHKTGDRFVPLAPLTTDNVQLTEEQIGQEITYRAVSVGQPISEGVEFTSTYDGADLVPYSPVHIEGTRDPDLTITWVRRSRIDQAWDATGDPALGEETEAYETDLWEGAALLRTVSTTVPTLTYTLAQYNSDTGGSATEIPSLTVKIHQMSAAVGRGTPGEANI